MIKEITVLFGAAGEPVSQALMHSLWQGALIASVLALGLILLKGSNPRLRYSLSCLAMVLILASSVATGLCLAFENNISADMASASRTGTAPPAGSVSVTSFETDPASASTPGAASGRYWNQDSIFRWFLSLWVIGVLVLSLYHMTGWRRARRLVSKNTQGVSNDWQERLRQLCHALKVSRPVRIMASSLIRVPCVVGWIKPIILVPVSTISGLRVEELEMILAHELGHIRRYDILFSYIQTAVETLLFFNPAVWWISRQIRIEREHCCDDLAIEYSGDRMGYARALANLEELRGGNPGFALAGAGGSLIHRVKRLMGISSVTCRISGAGAMVIFLLTATLVFGLGSIGGSLPVDQVRTGLNEETTFEPASDDIEGSWELETDGAKARLRIYFKRNWQSGFSLRLSDFSPELTSLTKYFELRRNAGTFHFKGEFEGEAGELWGEGDCYFRADPQYVKEMRRLGFRLKSNRDVLSFALHNITLDYVEGLVAAGYDDLSDDELLTAHIHDVTPEYISELDKLGYRDLDMDDLVTMQIHDVHPETIRKYQELGYKDLSHSQLVTMQIHDVDADYIAELEELGYHDLDCEQLVTMQIHDVNADYIAELGELGYHDLDSEHLVSMQIHDVDPGYIKELRDLGYDDLESEQLVTMRIHDVEPSFVRKLADLGYEDIDPEMLVSLKIHDVTPGYIRDLAELGYEDISLSDLISMQIHDVTISYIRKLQRRGYKDLTPEELIDRKIHGH